MKKNKSVIIAILWTTLVFAVAITPIVLIQFSAFTDKFPIIDKYPRTFFWSAVIWFPLCSAIVTIILKLKIKSLGYQIKIGKELNDKLRELNTKLGIGLRFENREALIAYIDSKITAEYEVYAYVKLDCGCEKTYPTPDDIPLTSDKCKHNFYFIKYD